MKKNNIIQPVYELAGRGAGKLIQIVNKLRYLVNHFIKIHSLNIGGGRNFIAAGWLNLEEVKSTVNPRPFKLSAECRFPFREDSIRIAYTSHCLEHLDNQVVCRTLAEVFRVLKEDGNFIIKIPDFDSILDNWRQGNAAFFTDNMWGYQEFTHTWRSRRISDCLDYRAAMLFCGFWNNAYGDYFSGKVFKNDFAYHGPPAASIEFLHKLIKECSPSQISAVLSEIVRKDEKFYHFSHQNAWSREELEKMLNLFDFRVISFDKDKITSKYRHISNINGMKQQSMYCWAKKAKKG